MRRTLFGWVVAFLTGTVCAVPFDQSQVLSNIPFEENRGQSDPRVAFQVRTSAGPLFVTREGDLVWNLQKTASSLVLVEHLVGGIAHPRGLSLSKIQVNYFHGANANKWHSAPTWEQVSLGEVWPKIEVSLIPRLGTVEKRFTLQSGADPDAIDLQVSGGELSLDNEHLVVGDQSRKFSAPIAWQQMDQVRRPVQVSYRLDPKREGHYGFKLGEYDPNLPVIIDPILKSTYLGGSDKDWIEAMAVNNDSVYVAGTTGSTDFPGIAGGVQENFSGSYDVFVARLGRGLRTISQVTFLGGADHDYATALALTPDGVYLTGRTYSPDFPGVSGGAQTVCGDCVNEQYDAFVSKLSLDLRTLYQSTYLGGEKDDWANAIAIHSGSVYVAGWTWSSDFPQTTGGAQQTCSSCTDGYRDSFVTRLTPDLKSIVQSTFLGGNREDGDTSLAVSTHGVYVSGTTSSKDFPKVVGGARSICTDCSDYSTDAFVSRISPDLKTLQQSTFLGGSGYDVANALAIASDGVYVTGTTWSTDFPKTAGGFQSSCQGCVEHHYDAFISKLPFNLHSVLQSTYLGGSQSDWASSLTVLPNAVYVTGWTWSTDFPGITNSAQQVCRGCSFGYRDAFISRLLPDLKSLSRSTYFGGNHDDAATVIALKSESLYIAGETQSTNLPGAVRGAQNVPGGGYNDAFVACFSLDLAK